MQELARQYPRYGYRRIQVFLARRGFEMSADRTYRLRNQAGQPGGLPEPCGSILWSLDCILLEHPYKQALRPHVSPRGLSTVSLGAPAWREGTRRHRHVAITCGGSWSVGRRSRPVITLIALLPISLFGLGVKDGAFVFFFGGAGVPTSVALAVSLVSYGVIIGASLLLGVIASVAGPPLPKVEDAAPEQDPP